MSQRGLVPVLSRNYASRLLLPAMGTATMRFRFPALFTVVTLALAIFCGQARAMQVADPSTLINQLVGQAITVIADKNTTVDQREQKFRSLLQSGFDIPRISRFVLGRYWNSATDEQRKQFGDLFEDWIVRTYSARFTQYSGEKIQVIGTRDEGPTTTVVISQFVSPSGAPPAKVEWVVRKSGDNDYSIVDVSIEGVSMALTQRDEIAAVADRSGSTVDGLNRAMQDKIKGAAAGPGK
jgi:phospholipid transport system substrate-binding protein